MKKITKRIALISCALFALSFNASAQSDRIISTFEPDATGEVGFSSYLVKTSGGTVVTSPYVSGTPSVQANDVVNSNNPSANCFKLVTADTYKRSGGLVFMYTNVTPTTAQKYLKLKVRRDYNNTNFRIFVNGTTANWNATANYNAKPSSVWEDVVINISTLAAAGTAITNLMLEPAENNSVSLGYPITICIDDVVLSETSTSRTTPLPGTFAYAPTVSGLSYTYGAGPSTEKSFMVSGVALSGDLTITPTAPYEISTTSGSGFTTGSLTLTPTSGAVAPTVIYTRLAAGQDANAYDAKNVVITTSGVTDRNVILSGTVDKANQTITFNSLADVAANATDFSPGATSATSSTNPITYTSSNELVATIVDGKIHPVATGTTQITASQAASTNYNAATSVSQTLNVTDTSTGLMLSGAEQLTSILSQNNEICVVAHSSLKVNIYDLNGSMMYSKMLNGSQIEIIPISKSGVYCVLATDNFGKTQMSKVLVK